MLSFLPLESHLTDEPVEEGADAWGATNAAIADILDKRTEEKSAFSAMVQLPMTGILLMAKVTCICIETGASPLGYTQTFMAVQIEWSFPTSPHSWLILATSSSPNYVSERR